MTKATPGNEEGAHGEEHSDSFDHFVSPFLSTRQGGSDTRDLLKPPSELMLARRRSRCGLV
jgi:hypothetical protein